MADAAHRIHRHPAAPWVELRQTAQTRDCYRPHTHHEYAIGIVDSGRATLMHGEGPHALQAGSVVFIACNAVHACNPSTSQPWSYRMLFVQADWLHQTMARHWGLLDTPDQMSFVKPAMRDTVLRDAMDQLCQPMENTADAEARTALLADTLARVARPAKRSETESRWPELNPALQVMITQLEMPPSVAELAQLCGMSTSHFIRHFKAAMQLTPGRYIQNLRVQGARQLLSQGMALAEASQAMGFSDQAHLQRAFKAHHAMTPGRYALASVTRS